MKGIVTSGSDSLMSAVLSTLFFPLFSLCLSAVEVFNASPYLEFQSLSNSIPKFLTDMPIVQVQVCADLARRVKTDGPMRS